MDDNDTYDFTFCKVDSEVVNTQVESPKAIPDVNKISLKDSFSDDKNYDSSQDKHLFPSLPKNIAAYSGFSFGGSNGMPQPYLKSNESLAIEVARVDGSSVIGLEREKLEPRKPIVRAKVPFEKGYSQMDWLKLTQTHPDLAELRGQTNKRLITMDEVKKHKTGGSIWTVLKGRVYNISPYMKFHPGGVDMLSKAAGKDCTLLFNKYHAWVNAEFLLEKCLVGVLDFDPSSV